MGIFSSEFQGENGVNPWLGGHVIVDDWSVELPSALQLNQDGHCWR